MDKRVVWCAQNEDDLKRTSHLIYIKIYKVTIEGDGESGLKNKPMKTNFSVVLLSTVFIVL